MANPLVKSGEIYKIDRPRLNNAQWPHYCVVMKVFPDGKVWANFLGSKPDNYRPESGDILLKSTDTDFATTNLSHSTYLINREYARIEIPISNLFELEPRVGYVSGDFKKAIEELSGLELEAP